MSADLTPVCVLGRHTECRPTEWFCSCPCHATADASASDDSAVDDVAPSPSSRARYAAESSDGASSVQEPGTVTGLRSGTPRAHTSPAVLRPTGSTL